MELRVYSTFSLFVKGSQQCKFRGPRYPGERVWHTWKRELISFAFVVPMELLKLRAVRRRSPLKSPLFQSGGVGVIHRNTVLVLIVLQTSTLPIIIFYIYH